MPKGQTQNAVYQKRWRERHPDLAKQRSQAWRAANPERRRATRKAAKVRRKGRLSPRGRLPGDQLYRRDDIYDRDGGRCHICKAPCLRRRYHIDHLVPLSAGGIDAPSNVAIAHPECNIKRGTTGPAQLRLV